MPAVEASGTQSATVGTEHTLATISTSKVLILAVDTVNMTNSDTLELRIKTKLLSAGASGLAYIASYFATQQTKIKYSVPVPSTVEAVFTLKQTAGTGRNFDWVVYSV